MGTNVFPYPTNAMQVVDPKGRPTMEFMAFLMQLWTRAGGAQGDTIGVALTNGEVLPLSDVLLSAGFTLPYPPGNNGKAPPDGWLLCDGRAVARATYPALFTAIGTAYGAGDHVSTFNLPNFGKNLAWNNALTLLPILSATQWIIKT